ncbi:MAG: hypothetical protein RI575_03185 [Balneolaceae bacterium]|nr:hypothetical protein [Balneolaceae bacterium]
MNLEIVISHASLRPYTSFEVKCNRRDRRDTRRAIFAEVVCVTYGDWFGRFVVGGASESTTPYLYYKALILFWFC